MDAGSLQGFVEKRREEYRKFLRFPLSLEAECTYNVGEKAERCRVVDISSHGLGLELDTSLRMQSGQLVLLEIKVAGQKTPMNAITKLAWVQRQEDGFMMQRVGSCLLFMDPAGQEQLMEQAYAGLLSNATKWGRVSPS
jgi:hypothetical protein